MAKRTPKKKIFLTPRHEHLKDVGRYRVRVVRSDKLYSRKKKHKNDIEPEEYR